MSDETSEVVRRLDGQKPIAYVAYQGQLYLGGASFPGGRIEPFPQDAVTVNYDHNIVDNKYKGALKLGNSYTSHDVLLHLGPILANGLTVAGDTVMGIRLDYVANPVAPGVVGVQGQYNLNIEPSIFQSYHGNTRLATLLMLAFCFPAFAKSLIIRRANGVIEVHPLATQAGQVVVTYPQNLVNLHNILAGQNTVMLFAPPARSQEEMDTRQWVARLMTQIKTQSGIEYSDMYTGLDCWLASLIRMAGCVVTQQVVRRNLGPGYFISDQNALAGLRQLMLKDSGVDSAPNVLFGLEGVDRWMSRVVHQIFEIGQVGPFQFSDKVGRTNHMAQYVAHYLRMNGDWVPLHGSFMSAGPTKEEVAQYASYIGKSLAQGTVISFNGDVDRGKRELIRKFCNFVMGVSVTAATYMSGNQNQNLVMAPGGQNAIFGGNHIPGGFFNCMNIPDVFAQFRGVDQKITISWGDVNVNVTIPAPYYWCDAQHLAKRQDGHVALSTLLLN